MSPGEEPASRTSSSPTAHSGSAELPLFPLHMVLFPGGPLRLRIFEPRYVDMIGNCMRTSSPFGVVLIRAGQEVGAVSSAASIGTSARIVDFSKLPDGLLGIACVGEQKFRVDSWRVQPDGLNVGDITWLRPEASHPLPDRYAHMAELLREVLPRMGELYTPATVRLDDASWVGMRLAEILPIPPADRQTCLELDDPLARLERLAPLIRRE